MDGDKKGKVEETLKEVIDYIGIIVRYTASGFIGLLILVVAEIPTNEKWQEIVKLFPWILLVIAVVMGLTVYAIHHVALDALMNFLSIRANKKNDDLYELKKERRKRRATNELRQKDIDTTFSLLNFLYCSSYLLTFTPLACQMLDLWKNQIIRFWHVLVFGVLLFSLAFVGDYLITKEEFFEFDSEKKE